MKLPAIAIAIVITAEAAEQSSTAIADGQCVVIYDVEAAAVWRSDEKACAVRLSPASTFKIPHALIALETGAITPDAVEKWDGRRFPRQTIWEQDHTLQSAISNSVLWFFQRTSVRIGPDRMKGWLQKFAYGNTDTSGDPTLFWVNGRLQITPEEQVAFLKLFFSDALPVQAEHLSLVRRALLQQPGTVRNATGLHVLSAGWPKSVQLIAKTGATTAEGTGVSWLVGAVDRKQGRQIFASAIWRAGGVEPLDAAKLAVAALAERALLK